MSELREFLLARIAEDEAVARAATSEYGPWELDDGDDVERCEVSVFPDRGGSTNIARTYPTEYGLRDAEHIARHDPARVLAECEAKRRIVEEHPLVASTTMDGVVGCDLCGWVNYSWGPELTENGPCPTLRALALPYADHPDYQEDWRP